MKSVIATGWGVPVLRIAAAAIGVGLALSGCVGSEPVAASSSLYGAGSSSLQGLTREQWASAHAGCEGLLGETVAFAIASADYELVAAIAHDGRVLCIDTLEAVEEELDESGRGAEADALASRVRALALLTDAARMGIGNGPDRAGDPDPEPNAPWASDFFDPDPEPN